MEKHNAKNDTFMQLKTKHVTCGNTKKIERDDDGFFKFKGNDGCHKKEKRRKSFLDEHGWTCES